MAGMTVGRAFLCPPDVMLSEALRSLGEGGRSEASRRTLVCPEVACLSATALAKQAGTEEIQWPE